MSLLDDAFELAAVSGVFTPEALAEALKLDATDRDAVWLGLSLQVTEVFLDSEPYYCWFLKPESRRDHLRGFRLAWQLEDALKRAPEPIDVFGRVLRKVLQDTFKPKGPEHLKLSWRELTELQRNAAAAFDAVQFAQVIPALDPEKLRELVSEAKRQIQILQRRQDMAIVIPYRHIGYETQRRRLSSFLRGKDEDDRPMLMTGIGGAGKSALIARILSHWQTRADKPITVILDFDRRQLNGGDPGAILRELFRQLETAITGKLRESDVENMVARELNTLRNSDIFSAVSGGGEGIDFLLGYFESSLVSSMESDWIGPLREARIALVLDSFEAVDRRGGDVVRAILEVERVLRTLFPHLRTVVSGRAKPLDDADIENFFGGRVLSLTGLSPAAGAALLSEHDKRMSNGTLILPDKAQREQVSALLRGHPLALIVFMQYAAEHRGDIDALVRELEHDTEFQAEFAQIFLYERILDRISDPALRSLAHPGLVLRQLSDSIIRYVLAGPCLGRGPDSTAPLTDAEAKDLAQRLADEYWLVEQGEPPFAMRHLPELRRMMVPGLFAGPRARDNDVTRDKKNELARKANEVCVTMAAYLRNGPPEAADVEAQQEWAAYPAEKRELAALYYESFVSPDDVPTLTTETARSLEDFLGSDVETMPLPWRASLAVLQGRVPTDVEFDALPAALRAIGEELIADQKRAFGLGSSGERFDDREKSTPPKERRSKRSDARSVTAIETEISTAFAEMEFEEVASLMPQYIQATSGDIERRRALWEEPFWQGLLVAGADLPYPAEPLADVMDDVLKRSEELPWALQATAWDDGRLDINPSGMRKALLERREPHVVDVLRAQSLRADPVVPPYAEALCAFAQQPSLDRGKWLLTDFKGRSSITLYLLRASGPSRLTDFQLGYEKLRGQGSIHFPASLTAKENKVWHRMRRGLNPDLYPPTIYALRRLEEDESIDLLVEMFRQVVAYWPTELEPYAKRRTWRTLIPALVQTADQCGALRRLLKYTSKFDPQVAEITALYDQITGWFFGPEVHASILELTSIDPNAS